MKDKTCIVTGANRGLGKAIAAALAQRGATVVLACRERASGEAAIAELKATTQNSSLELLLVDLANQSSIRQAARDFAARHERLDVLLHNAAVYKMQHTLTSDGLEMMFATNHLAQFLLTNLLLNVLKISAPSRVLVVTAPSTTRLNFGDLQGAQHFSPLQAFGASKMCNLLFTYELAKRLAGTGVTANAVHPGLVKSDLMREAPFILRGLLQLTGRTPAAAAESVVYLAESPDVATISGKFFKGRKPIESNAYSHDRDVQRRLWDVSANLTQTA